MQNRESAVRSRLRKRYHQDDLEVKIQELEDRYKQMMRKMLVSLPRILSLRNSFPTLKMSSPRALSSVSNKLILLSARLIWKSSKEIF